MDKIRIGLIGCGGIANSRHLPELSKTDGVEIHALCDCDEETLNKVANKYGVPSERRFTDYHELIRCNTVDAVDICTPNYLHCPMAEEAVQAGKPFCVEKPVGMDAAETLRLLKKAEKAAVPSMVCFSYRFMPAVRFAKQYVAEGKLGKINSVYAQYLKSSAFMEGRRLDWRFVKKYARYGVSGDLAVHILDLTTFLTGKIKRINSDICTVVKERKHLDSEELAAVETDDICDFLAEYENGALGTFGITRCATGNTNTISIDVYGDKGAIRFNLNHSDKLWMYKDGEFQEFDVPEEYFLHDNQMREFVRMLQHNVDPYIPTLQDGYNCQKVLDAIMDSAETRQWVTIV